MGFDWMIGKCAKALERAPTKAGDPALASGLGIAPIGRGRRPTDALRPSSLEDAATNTQVASAARCRGAVLQAIQGWPAADLRGWAKEHQSVRWVLVVGGLRAAPL